jgi:hypothetical protein
MAINPYMTPAKAPMMDTYVPIPFQEMMQAGALTQKRYDDQIALEDATSDQILSLQGASKLYKPGFDPNDENSYVDLPDAKVVENFQNDFYSQIDEITTSNPNAADQGRRNSIRKLITKTKRALSPTGDIGIAMSNSKQIEDFNAMLRNNPKLANSPQMVPFIKKIEAHKQAVSEGKISRLDLSGAPGEDVDVSKKLTDLLKNYGERANIPGIGHASGLEGVIQQLQSSGISKAEIQKTVIDYLNTDRDSYNQLALESEWSKMHGKNTEVSDLISGYAGIMGDVFSKSTLKSNLMTDQAYMKRLSKSLDPDEIEDGLTSPVVLYDKLLGIKDPKDLKEAQTSSNNTLESSKMNLDNIVSRLNLKSDDNGNITKADGSPLDESDILNLKPFREAYKESLEVKQSYDNLHNKAVQVSGFNPVEIAKESDYYKQYSDDKETFFVAAKVSNAGEFRDWRNEAIQIYGDSSENIDNKILAYQKKKFEEKVLEESIDRLDRTGSLKSEDLAFQKKYKKYKEALTELGGNNSYIANIKSFIPGKEKTIADTFVSTSYADPKSMIGGVEITGGDYSGVDLKENKDAWENLKISSKHPPKSLGLFIDRSEGGSPKMLLQYYKEDGSIATNAKVDAPYELVKNSLIRNDMEQAEFLINSKLESKLGALKPYNDEQNVNLSYSNESDAPIAKVLMPSGDGTRNYITVTVNGKKLPPIENSDKLRTVLSVISMDYESKKNKK